MKLINNESRNDRVLNDGENNQSTRSYPDFSQYTEPRQSHVFLRSFDVRLLWLHYYNRGAIKSLRWHNRHPFIISQDIQSSSQISLLAEQPLQSLISGCDIITTEPWAILQVIFILLKINCSLQTSNVCHNSIHTVSHCTHRNLLHISTFSSTRAHFSFPLLKQAGWLLIILDLGPTAKLPVHHYAVITSAMC